MFDYLSGVRMHVSYLCIGGISDDLFITCLDYVALSMESCSVVIDILDLCFCVNRILYTRLRGIALIGIIDVSCNSVSGILARSTGLL